MSVMLPKEINYTQLPVAIPGGCQNFDVALRPVNGSSFSCATAGQIVAFDIPARSGYMDGKTLSLSYQYRCVSTGMTRIRCTPFTAPLSRLEVVFGSQTAQNVPNYNVVQNMLTNLKYSVADKIGNITGYGWGLEPTAVPAVGVVSAISNTAMTLAGCDGRVCVANEVGTFYGPLNCILSSADKYIPLGMMPNVRVQLTLDSIANIFSNVATVAVTASADNIITGTPTSTAVAALTALPTDFILDNFVLSYSHIDMGAEIDSAVRSMGDKIVIKSESFTNSANTIPVGTNGQIELLYSQKLASIKSLFLHCSSDSVNGIFDAFQVLGNSGDLVFNIASKLYPSNRPLSSAIQNRGTLQLELKKAVTSLYDVKSGMSISPQEYINLGTESTLHNPAKVYYGVNCEQLQSNDVLLSGVSSQNSQITARLNISSVTGRTVNASLIACFDVLIEIEPSTRSAFIRQ